MFNGPQNTTIVGFFIVDYYKGLDLYTMYNCIKYKQFNGNNQEERYVKLTKILYYLPIEWNMNHNW